MELQTALNNINFALRSYRGTADEHDTLKESLQTIVESLNRLLALENTNTGNNVSLETAVENTTVIEQELPSNIEE